MKLGMSESTVAVVVIGVVVVAADVVAFSLFPVPLVI